MNVNLIRKDNQLTCYSFLNRGKHLILANIIISL